jgi:hypothetical protein
LRESVFGKLTGLAGWPRSRPISETALDPEGRNNYASLQLGQRRAPKTRYKRIVTKLTNSY